MTDLKALVDDFIQRTKEEDPKLGKGLGKLGSGPKEALGEVLHRFDRKDRGTLDETERALARRILTLLYRPSGKGLKKLLSVLDFLDIDENRTLEAQELRLGVDILESFCKADSLNDTLSTKELEIIEVVLKHLDTEGKGVLDSEARNTLRESLWDPDAFLAELREAIPKLNKLMD